jgi:spermidine synthase
MNDAVPRRLVLSVATLSAGVLANEILLTRLFAIIHSYHFASMMISLALLGFGMSGTCLALGRRWLMPRFGVAYLANALLFGVLAIAAPLLARSLPFNVEELLWNPVEPLWLLLTYLVLTLPFLCAANAIGLALIVYRANAGRIYAADLAGAGLGSAVLLGLLYLVPPESALRVVAGSGLAAALLAASVLAASAIRWQIASLAGIGLLILLPGEWLRIEPGPYKPLSQALQVQGTRLIAERSSPMGRISVVESARVPLRHAPGLSLHSTAEPPTQLGIFTDGDNMDAITAATADPQRLEFLEQTTAALAYSIASPQSVLIVGAGGGLEILRALRFRATHIDAIEINAQHWQLLREDFRDYSGRLLEQPGVAAHVGDVRGFVSASHRHYDLIQLSLAGSAGAGGGLGGLNEDYLDTVEAFRLYLAHLEPDGWLSITRWVQVPPRDALKLIATMVRALKQAGVRDPAQRLLMIRSWQTTTLLVRNGAVTTVNIARLRAFSDAQGFDLVWYPGMAAAEADRYHELSQPWFYEGARALLGTHWTGFVAAYPFDIRPATDDRPYFQNFFRWSSLAEAWRSRGRGGMALLEVGYLVLAATIVQALAAGIALVVLPLLVLRRQRQARRTQLGRVLAYFGAIGLGFLFIEIVFLQKVLLFVHQPTVALGLVLAVFLVAGGAGSAWAGRSPSGPAARRRLRLAVSAILVLGTAYALTYSALLEALVGSALLLKACLAALLLAPLAFFMGAPFPLAMRELDAALAAWGWGINGCASVVSAPLATLLAIDSGLTAVLGIALGLYAGVLMLFPMARSSADEPRAVRLPAM